MPPTARQLDSAEVSPLTQVSYVESAVTFHPTSASSTHQYPLRRPHCKIFNENDGDVIWRTLIPLRIHQQSQHVRLGLVHPHRNSPNPDLRCWLHPLLTIPRETKRSCTTTTILIQSICEERSTYRKLPSVFGRCRLGQIETLVAEESRVTYRGLRAASRRYIKKRVGS